jgi:hypothetical protein
LTSPTLSEEEEEEEEEGGQDNDEEEGEEKEEIVRGGVREMGEGGEGDSQGPVSTPKSREFKTRALAADEADDTCGLRG